MRIAFTVRSTSVCRTLIMRQGRVYRIIVALILVITFAAPGGAATSKHSLNVKERITDSADLSALRERLKARLEESHQAASFPGATIGFVLPDGRSGSVSVGLADVEKKTLLKPSDRMLAGS